MRSSLKLEYANRQLLDKKINKKKGSGSFNIADWISLYRIISWPFIILVLVLEEKNVFAWLLLISFVSDIVDGILARKLRIISDRGAKLDSIGDFLTLVAAVAGFIYFEPAFIADHLFIISVAIGLYLLQMLLAFIKYGRLSSFHTLMAKITFVVLGVFLLTVFFFGVQEWLFYIGIGLSILEVIEEIFITLWLSQWKTNVRGLYWVVKEE